MSEAVEYRAFISYSHRDEAWAKWLHRALETYRVPARLVGRETRDGAVPKRLFPIFRDREELPGSADLGGNIADALARSRYLLVICSPHAAASRWVNEEVAAFKALGREDRVLSLIVDGEPNADDKPGAGLLECFPPALRVRVRPDRTLTTERVEPIAADARPGKDGRRDALLKIVAGLLGVRFDELRQRDRVRRRWRRVQVGVAACAVIAALAGTWAWRARVAGIETLVEQGRQELLAGRGSRAAVLLSEAYSRGARDPALRFMLARAMEAVDPAVTVIPAARSAGTTWSPDGRYLAVTGPHISVWDAATGERLLTLDEDVPAQTPVSVHFSPTLPRLWLAIGRTRAAVWDLEARRRVGAIESSSEIGAGTFAAPDFARAVVSRGPDVTIVDVASGTRTALPPHDAPVTHVRFLGDASRVLVVSDRLDHLVAELWDARTLTRMTRWPDPRRAAGEQIHKVIADGRRVVTRDLATGRVGMWNTATGRPLFVLEGPGLFARDETLRSLQDGLTTFSARGALLATFDADGRGARLWNADTGAFAAALRAAGPGDVLHGLAFAPDGTRVVTATRAGVLELWSRDGTLIHTLAREGAGSGEYVFLGDGAYLHDARTSRLWSLTTGIPVGDFDVKAVARTTDGRRFLTLEDDRKTVRVRDMLSGTALATYGGHAGEIGLSGFSADGRHVMTRDEDASIHIWKAVNAPITTPIHAHGDGPYGFFKGGALGDARFTPDGARVVTASTTGSVRLWDAASGARVAELGAHRAEAVFARVSPDGAWAATAGLDGAVVLWSLTDGRHRVLRADQGAEVRWLSFDPAGRRLVTAGSNGTLKLWTVETGALLRVLAGHRDTVDLVQWNRDGTRLLSSGADGVARIWNPDATAPVHELKHGESRIHAHFTPAADRVVSVDEQDGIAIWDAASGALLQRTEPPRTRDAGARDARDRLAVGDARTLVHAPQGQELTLVDSASGRLIAVLESAAPVYSMALSPDQAFFATASPRGVTFWSASDGRRLASYPAHRDTVTALQFSSDGTRMLTAGADGFAYVWRTAGETRSPGEVAARVRCVAPWRVAGGTLVPNAMKPYDNQGSRRSGGGPRC